MPEKFVERKDNLKAIEQGIRNKFKFAWLEEKDCNGDYLSDYVRKKFEPGLAYCLYCKQVLDYSTKGKSFIKRHAESGGHKSKRNAVKNTQSLPAIFRATTSLERGETPEVTNPLPYGTANNVMDSHSSVSTGNIGNHEKPQLSPPSFKDRVSQQEAMICAFLAEHTLPLNLAAHLVKLAQALSSDHKALQTLSMERFSTTYKLKYGLHEVTRKRIVNRLKNTPFSINLDEATSKSNKKRVLNVLVCFFDSDLGESVTHLYVSVELTVVNATTVHSAVVNKLREDNIPLDNLISSLSDSAAYMRGSQNGYEAKLRADAPHLLQIDGDVCHHIHNTTRQFSAELDEENHLAHLVDDIHKDFVYSPDIREEFSCICKIMGVQDKQPKERVGHRWMSLLDSSQSLDELSDPLTILYYSWLNKKDRDIYKDVITKLFLKYKVTPAGRQTIFTIMRRLRVKNMTDFGKKRKKRVCIKLFDKRRNTDLLTKAVVFTFPMFKKFILAFETKKPMLHKLYDKVVFLFREFLQLFIKAEDIRESNKQLQLLDLTDTTKYIPTQHLLTGECESILKECPKEDALIFRKKLLQAFVSTGQYMQKKLPLGNTVLSTLSLLDPLAFGQTDTAILLKKLPTFFPTINAPNFNEQIMKMQADVDIVVGQEIQLDVWWNAVFKLKRYPSVEKIVTACLSIFTGPRVEQSFSLMNMIINQRASSLHTSTYEAILCIKYFLLAQHTSAIKLFSRADATFSPVDASLAWHLQTSNSRYLKFMKETKAKTTENEQRLGVKRKASPSHMKTLPPKKQRQK